MQLEPTSEASSPLGMEASANGKFKEVGDKIRGRGGRGGEGELCYMSFMVPGELLIRESHPGLLCGVKLKHRHERSTCFSLRRSSAHGFPPLAVLFKDSNLPQFNRSTLKRAYVIG